MGLGEDFDAYVQTKQESQAYSLEQQFDQYQKEMAAGGSIRQSPLERKPRVGALIGGVTGALAALPTANPAIIVGTGAITAAGGEAIQQLYEHATGDPAAPQSTGEAAGYMLEEAGLQTASELGGRAIGMPLAGRHVPSPFSPRNRMMTQEGERAIRYLEPRMPQGFLPQEVTTSRTLDVLGNIAEYSIVGGGAIKEFKANREKVFQGIADELVDQLGPRQSADDAGRAVLDATKRNLETARIPAKMIYNSIEKAAAPDYVAVPRKMTVQRTDTPVMRESIDKMNVRKIEGKQTIQSEEGDITEEPMLEGMKVRTTYQDIQVGERLEHLKVMVTTQEQQVSGARINLSPIKEQIAGLTKIAQQAGGLEDRAMGTTLLTFMAEKPDVVSYPVAKQIRTEIRTLKAALQNSIENKNSPAIGKAGLLNAQLTQQIRSGLNEYDPFLSQMWDEANLIEAGAQKQFNDSLIRSMIKKGDETGRGKPEAIVKAIFQPNSETTIKRVKNAVADNTQWDKMLSVELQDLVQASSDKAGLIDGVALEQKMFGRTGIGEGAMVAAFGSQRVGEYKAFINALKVAQANQSEGTGRMLIQLKQGQALSIAMTYIAADKLGLLPEGAGGYSEEAQWAAGLIILGPYVISKALTNPTTARLITRGLTLPAKSPEATALAGRIISSVFPRTERPQPADTAERRRVTPPSTSVQPMGNQY